VLGDTLVSSVGLLKRKNLILLIFVVVFSLSVAQSLGSVVLQMK